MSIKTRFVVEEASSEIPTPPLRVANRLKKRFDVSPVVDTPSSTTDPQDSVNSDVEAPRDVFNGRVDVDVDEDLKIDGK